MRSPTATMKMACVDGTDQVLVVNSNGRFSAMQGICSHEYFELDKGFLTAGTLTCALHLSRFDLDSGEPLDPPAELPLEVYHGRRRGRPDPHRGPGRPARRSTSDREAVAGRYERPVSGPDAHGLALAVCSPSISSASPATARSPGR